MNVQAIVGNVIDRCGDDLIKEKLPTGTVTMHVLNTLEILGNELANTFKGTFALKSVETIIQQTGQLAESPIFLYRPQFVRYRLTESNINSPGTGWQELFVLNDIEEITHAENVGRPSIWFYGKHPFNYQLSFVPLGGIQVEIWGQNVSSVVANLSVVPQIPAEFAQYVAIRAALVFLDDLLLLNDAPRYQAFFSARKQTLMEEIKVPKKTWTNFLNRDENRNLSMNIEPFDIFAEDSYEETWIRQGVVEVSDPIHIILDGGTP